MTQLNNKNAETSPSLDDDEEAIDNFLRDILGTDFDSTYFMKKEERIMPKIKKWNKETAIQRFIDSFCKDDTKTMYEAMKRLARMGHLEETLTKCHDIKNSPMDTQRLQTLLYFWNTYGYYFINVALTNNLFMFSDLLKKFAPPYMGEDITLYRGEISVLHKRNQYGIAWTSKLKVAEDFSRIRTLNRRDVVGVVIKLTATPDIIVAHLPSHITTRRSECEDEYIIDVKNIADKVEVLSYYYPNRKKTQFAN
jgi:hypothetical protein